MQGGWTPERALLRLHQSVLCFGSGFRNLPGATVLQGNQPRAETRLESDVSLSPTVDVGVGSAFLGFWGRRKSEGCGGKEACDGLVTLRGASTVEARARDKCCESSHQKPPPKKSMSWGGGDARHILCSCLSKGCLASLPPLVNMGATGVTVTFKIPRLNIIRI